MVIVEIKSFSFDYTQTAATIALNFFRARAASCEPTPRSRMKAKRQPVKLQAKRTAPPGAQTYLLGVDGGGTKTRAVVVDARQRILGEGDEGSGSWIARRALQAVARASDGRGRKTSLVEAACEFFNVSKAEDLSTAVYAPNMTNNRIAGFGRHVIEAAKRRDHMARAIVEEAGRRLAQAAGAVLRQPSVGHQRLQGAYARGVFSSDGLRLDP